MLSSLIGSLRHSLVCIGLDWSCIGSLCPDACFSDINSAKTIPSYSGCISSIVRIVIVVIRDG